MPAPRAHVEKVGTKKNRERKRLLWKLGVTQGQDQKYFNDDLNGKVKNRAHGLWEVWSASHADALKICREHVEGVAEGISTHCTVEEEKESALPHC